MLIISLFLTFFVGNCKIVVYLRIFAKQHTKNKTKLQITPTENCKKKLTT